MNNKKVICWGDSLTIGMGMKRNETYPAFLGELLGCEYKVINAGSSDEMSHTIAARQGAIKTYISKDLSFEKGVSTIKIGIDNDHGMCTLEGEKLDINKDGEAFFLTELPCNSIFINDENYTFTVKDGVFELSRVNTENNLIIPKGSEVVFSSAIEQEKGSYCEIFLVGANDKLIPTDKQVQALIECYKEMIEKHGNGCYLVIVPYWASAYLKPFIEAFGDKAIDFASAITENNCREICGELCKEDDEIIARGGIPKCLLWQNDPIEIHLNRFGYRYLANVLYERGKEIGYW